MRWILWLFLGWVPTFLLASQAEIAAKILDQTAIQIFKSEKIAVWTELPEHREIVKASKHLELVTHECDAQLVLIVSTMPKQPREDAVYFGMSYEALSQPGIIGAFFWQKGRPNLLFVRQRLARKGITLGTAFEKYIEDRL